MHRAYCSIGHKFKPKKSQKYTCSARSALCTENHNKNLYAMVKKIPKRFQLKFISCEVANRFREKAHFQQSLVKIFSIKSKGFIVLIMGIGGGIEMDWAKSRRWYTWVNILNILINTTTSIQSSLGKILQINRFNLKMTISHHHPPHQEKVRVAGRSNIYTDGTFNAILLRHHHLRSPKQNFQRNMLKFEKIWEPHRCGNLLVWETYAGLSCVSRISHWNQILSWN